MTVLLDANVLIALLVDDHVHHDAAESWFARIDDNFATCPITQGSLMRLLIREGQSAAAAQMVIRDTTAHPGTPSFTPKRTSITIPTNGLRSRPC